MTPPILFSYPRRGLSGEFATFRLGATAATKYPTGEVVELLCARSKKLLKRATVMGVHMGSLTEMATLYGRHAHNWLEHPEADRPALLIASMLKRYKHYGPTRCNQNSICSVIYLKEEPNGIL